MFLSVLDPDLFFYDYAHWYNREPHCFDRFEALTLHRRMIREYGQKMALSNELAALINQYFPWHGNFRTISELRDLRQFIFEDLQKAEYFAPQTGRDVSLLPAGIVCRYVNEVEIIETWEALLCGCVDEQMTAEFDPQVGAWPTPLLNGQSGSITLTIHDSEGDADTQHNLPVVWNEDTWAVQLSSRDWWPNLERCVDLHFKTNPGLRGYSGRRETPISFECSEEFWACLNTLCTSQYLRRSFIEALTKKLYGVLDASLGDEQLGDFRRFRVTNFWRVHYRYEDSGIVLEEFGPHDIGGVA